MSLLTIFAFEILRVYPAERNQFYKAAHDGFSFSRYKVTSAGCAAYSHDSSFNDNLVQVQQCHNRE